MIDCWLVVLHLSPRRARCKFTVTDCEARRGGEVSSRRANIGFREVWRLQSCVLCRGHGRGRGRGDFRLTQMCEADRNSGYLANKSRKAEDEAGRRRVCAAPSFVRRCEQAMTRRFFTWYRDAAGAAGAERLFMRRCQTRGDVLVPAAPQKRAPFAALRGKLQPRRSRTGPHGANLGLV